MKKEALSIAYKLQGEKRRIERKLSKVISEREKCDKLVPNYGGVDGSSGGGNSTEVHFSNYSSEAEEYERELREQLNEIARACRKVEQICRHVKDEKTRTILLCRYVNFEEWEEIAVHEGYTYRRVLQLHADGLDALTKKDFT